MPSTSPRITHQGTWLVLAGLALAPGLQAQPGQPPVRAEPASKPAVLPAKQPVLKAKPAQPRQCKPGEMDAQCLTRSEEALRLTLEVAANCPDCVPPEFASMPPRPMNAGKPVRPQDFCVGVERVARLNGLQVKCTAQ